MTTVYKYLKRHMTLLVAFVAVGMPVSFGSAVFAATDAPCTTGNETSCTSLTGGCGANNGLGNCPDPAATAAPNQDNVACTEKSCNLISKYINPFISLLAALVGIAVTVSIIIGGIQYSSSNGNSQQITAAKARIRNSLIALLAFFFLYAFLQFLVPGGIFRT